MDSKDKNILAKLVKIANNQQKILEKLAQVVPAMEPSNDIEQFIKHNFTSWGMPLEVVGKAAHSVRVESGSKHYEVRVALTLANKSQKVLAEDPVRGFGAFLNKRFSEASVDGGPFAGYTATFNVTAN